MTATNGAATDPLRDIKGAVPNESRERSPANISGSDDHASATTRLLSGHVLGMLAALFGFGLLLSFTPCVFPMIPILSGMLAPSGEHLSAKRGFVLSGVYVLAMALAYAALGIAAAWSGQNLQIALQTRAQDRRSAPHRAVRPRAAASRTANRLGRSATSGPR
jgi:thiol:disulfide interchange protein